MKALGNIRDIFKTLKHRKPSPIFCPKCCSPELKLSSSLDYWLTPQKYICQKCGYVGNLVMELEEENEEKTETLEK